MDLNNIVIPPSVLADLYSDTLIAANDHSQVPVPKESGLPEKEAPWKSLGNNQRNILVVLNNPNAIFLADHELGFLTGILSACKLSMDDIALVNLHHYPSATYKELSHFYKSKIVLLFETEPAAFGLPMSFPHYQLQAFANNTFLYAPSLKELENDKVEKSKLWVCLKRLFNL